MTAATDPTIQAWRQALATLGSALVELEADPTVTLARTGCLVGGSAGAWDLTEAGLALAWETYRAVDALLDDAEKDPERAASILTTSTVAGTDGPTDPTTAMRAAKAAADAAAAFATRLSTAWGETSARLADARAAVELGDDLAGVRAADAVADLLASDPLAVHESDIAAIESMAAAATARRSAAQLATSRLDLDLAHAQALLATVRSGASEAASQLAHAASRIAGIVPAEPIPDLDALADRLDEISATPRHDPERAAAALRDWLPAATARQAELDAALVPARDGLRRREEGRGLWEALRAKAAARRVDERDDVAAALREARDLLWKAPCDLDAAEAALARLTAVLQTETR